ncbi:MAG: endo-1,4-beta-xylanase [Tunicatimonas sp.]
MYAWFLLFTVSLSSPFAYAQPTPTLRTQATFPVGVAVRPTQLAQPEFGSVVAHEFSQLTAENAMKPKYTWLSEHHFDFAPGDSIVAFAEQHRMRVHGHTLVWHFMPPRWLEEALPTYDSARLENMLRTYIYTVAGHYRGRVGGWDVVNEVINQAGDGLRESVYFQTLGEDYPARLFQYARAADPDALLFYNDYDLVAKPEKLRTVLAMVDDFQARSIPIDGVGLQMHIELSLPIEQLQTALDELVQRGLRVHLSEVDIKANPKGETDRLTPELAEAQRALMREIVRIYDALPEENKYAITFWGLRDNDSWLNTFTPYRQWPLLFGENYEKKPMYEGFLEGLE